MSNPGQLGKLTSVDQVNQVGSFPNKDLWNFNLKLQLLGLTVANRSVLGGMSKVISTIINIIINTTINTININNITCNLDSGHE